MEKGYTIKVLDHGHVTFIDAMGSDEDIVAAARMSTGRGFISWEPYKRCKKCDVLLLSKGLTTCGLCGVVTNYHLSVCPSLNCKHDWSDFPRGDLGILDYLYRNRHTTPFEMCELIIDVQVPMDAWRQWIRHRTACLAGNVSLHFDLPGGIERRGNQLYKLTVKDVFDRFQATENTTRPDRQGDPYLKRDRVQEMHLRCLNEETQAVEHTSIVDIWESGVKPVYRVELANGATATMSEDHLCLTEVGWLRLKEIVPGGVRPMSSLGALDALPMPSVKLLSIGPGRDTGVVPFFPPHDEATEEWRSVRAWEGWYEVSNQGRVRRVVGGRGSRSFGRCKKLTVVGGHAVVSLNRPGQQVVEQVHQLVLEAFVSTAPVGMECCHNDGNGLNNYLGNLRWDTPQGNAKDRVRDEATTGLRSNLSPIVSITSLGEQMTYDLEVSGPWHNFSAGGMVVHNSVNEYSTRYTEAIDLMAKTDPAAWRTQGATNRQGSGAFLPVGREALAPLDGEGGALLSQREREFHEFAREVYEERLAAGVAKEQARKDLPLSTYTAARWKCDLKNLLGFLSLRMHTHAQLEIRTYANAVAEIVKSIWPRTYALFEEHDLHGVHLSRTEAVALSKIREWMCAETRAAYGGVDATFEGLLMEGGLDEKEAKALAAKLGAK